jgi:hypothetical protein
MLQFDFVGNIYSVASQMEFSDERTPVFNTVERYFHSVSTDEINRHKEYWMKIIPDSSEEVFKRYLFAFLSVHTTYERNMEAYKLTKDWYNWFNKEDVLLDRLKQSGAGLFNNRTKYISAFAVDYWSDSKKYQKQQNESWIECRDRIEKLITGLGIAKSSFALEMIYPLSAQLTCLDVHLFRFYGLDQTKDRRLYKTIEQHWINWSKMFNMPPYIARAIYWNRNQNKLDCSYWADCL